MKPLSIALTALLGLALGAAHAQPPHAAHPAASPDSRAVLALTPEERVMVLEEMRLFLEGVQKMTGALGRQDMQAVAAASRSMGQVMVHEVPPALRAKLPMEFRQLGASVHRDFDQIALDAESLEDPRYSLTQLSATLQKCVSCHEMYQIRVTPVFDGRH